MFNSQFANQGVSLQYLYTFLTEITKNIGYNLSKITKEKDVLILTRRIGESIVIDGEIIVKVLDSNDNQIKLGIEAPPDIIVDREEIHNRRLTEHWKD